MPAAPPSATIGVATPPMEISMIVNEEAALRIAATMAAALPIASRQGTSNAPLAVNNLIEVLREMQKRGLVAPEVLADER